MKWILSGVVITILLFFMLFVKSAIYSDRVHGQHSMITHPETESSVINKIGSYSFGDSQLNISNNSGLVSLQISKNGQLLLDTSSKRASAFSRWVFVVESQWSIWLVSSDIGIYNWKFEEGHFTEKKVNIESADIPIIVYDVLPSSMKKLVSKERPHQ